MSTWLNTIGLIFGGILIFAFVDWLDGTKFMFSIRDYVNKNMSEGTQETLDFFLSTEALLFYFGFLYLYILRELGIGIFS